MFKIIKNFHWIIGTSFLCVFLGILTFLTFIDKGFLALNEFNLQFLLILDLTLLLVFFTLIYRNIRSLHATHKANKTGSRTNLRYISLFTLFTFIPALLIAIFSLFLFNFSIQNFFNDQITRAVNNSYDVANNYLLENKKTVESDVFLMSVGINRASNLFYTNPKRFKDIVRSEKLLRRVDDIYLIDSTGSIILSDTQTTENNFITPTDLEFDKALEGLPVIISNDTEDKTSVMIKLNSLIDTYLFISRNIDPKILNYLNETKEAVDFYYSVENNQLGLKVTFLIIYIIIVTLLLFLSAVIAISFASRLTKPIVNLISASENISKGFLSTKVPKIDTDEEFQMLNNNFNNMIDRLKKQQDKLLIAERHEAWENVARKLAHEIKNPLTPIQLSIDRLQEKYSKKINEGKEDFIEYLNTINRQIKDIENLVNEFSSFARMPSPIFKKININETIYRAINFIKMSSDNLINMNAFKKNIFIHGDDEQLYRVFINLIKNSEESFVEKKAKKVDFIGKIDIVITSNNSYISIKLKDNGTGILDTKKVMTPYFTTKKKGTGLGLPIVSKIISEHKGELLISSEANGTKILINLPSLNQ